METCKPYFIYAQAEVKYDGRATSTLEAGNYVILIKPDGSIQIHGADLVKPLNYMRNAEIIMRDDMIIAKSKKETITINILEIHSMTELPNWSDAKISLFRTEAELVDKIVANPDQYGFDSTKYFSCPEYLVTGCDEPVDVVFFPLISSTECMLRVVEVKRNKINKDAVYQLQRYIDGLRKRFADTYGYLGYLAAPGITASGRVSAEEHGFKYVKVDFDE